MKLIKPYYEILSEIDGVKILKNIERAGRVCYKSEDKITDISAEKFVSKLLKSKHESVVEHQSLSVLFVCDRGVSHEIVRHRIASFSQESTRYCNYSKDKFGGVTFIIPPWLDIEEGVYDYNVDGEIQSDSRVYKPEDDLNLCIFLSSLLNSEDDYLLLTKKSNRYADPNIAWSPQQARAILPNALKTEIVVTANLREWRAILAQRTASGAHPQMRELMIPLLKELSSKIPQMFDDININV